MRFLRTAILCLLPTLAIASDLAEAYFKAAENAEKAGDTLNAYLLYSKAAKLAPQNVAYAAKQTSLRLTTARTVRTEVGPDPAAPDEIRFFNTMPARDILEARMALPPPQLLPSSEKKSFHLNGDARTIFEQVAAAFGIQVTFDPDYQSPPPFQFRLDNADFAEAMHGLEDVSNSFIVPINPRLAMVVRDTPAKRAERMPVIAATIPIPERLTPQDAEEIVTTLRGSLDIRRVQLDPQKHQIVVRDQSPKVDAARALVAMLSHIRPQVELEVEFIEVDKNSSLGYGISLPNQISLVDFMGSVTLPVAYRALTHITGSGTPYGIGIGNASIIATLSRASASNLLDAQLTALDGQAATLHIGQRYPIASNQYIGNTAGQVGQVYTPPPTINFEDLGLVLKVTPSFHADEEIDFDLESEFKTLGATSPVAGIPIINSRKYNAKVRMREGEWAIIAGLVEVDDVQTRVGWPGLMSIPLLGRLFSTNTTQHDSTEVLVMLKPHITALAPWESVTHPIWVGTDSRPLTIH